MLMMLPMEMLSRRYQEKEDKKKTDTEKEIANTKNERHRECL